MERNDQSTMSGSGTGASGSAAGGGALGNVSDEARSRVQQAKDAVADRAGQVREKATELKATLADKLETGAGRLRQRTRETAHESAGESEDLAGAASERVGQYGDAVATGMERTAGWLRQGDFSDIGDAITDEVQSHPVRTLLIAVGIGYLIGRALKD